MADTPGFNEIRDDLNRRYTNRLEEAMLDVGIRKKIDLARIAGVSYEAITKGMKTGTLMNIHTALRIADALEISLDELYGIKLDQAGPHKAPKKFSMTVSRGQILRDNIRKPWLKARVIVPPPLWFLEDKDEHGSDTDQGSQDPGQD